MQRRSGLGTFVVGVGLVLASVAGAQDYSLVKSFPVGGEGGWDYITLTVVREVSPERFEVAQTVKTQRSARTLALDTKTHRLLLPAAELGPAPSPAPGQPRPRPELLPGSFRILAVGR